MSVTVSLQYVGSLHQEQDTRILKCYKGRKGFLTSSEQAGGKEFSYSCLHKYRTNL